MISSVESSPDQYSNFNRNSGTRTERLIFNYRSILIIICSVLTAYLGWQATMLEFNANFTKMIPTGHPYIANYLKNRDELKGLFPNAIRIAVVTRKENIFDAEYLGTLQKISDEVYLLPGVDRPFMKSLWAASTRWLAVTVDGFDGGPVVPDDYDGSATSLAQVKNNVERSGEIGTLVAPDYKSSIIFVPLLEINTQTGLPLDYAEFAEGLERIRVKYQSEAIELHVTGFAAVVGELIRGLKQVLVFFALAVAISTVVLFAYTRCQRSTLLVVLCSVVAVVWQLGLIHLLHFQLDPFSVLVPFLIFAIGMSHGAQKMNGITQDIGRGASPLIAARLTFRRLFLAGLIALLCDVVGFAVLMLIDIQTIQDLATIASLGVALLIFTNLILLPVLLSYVGVSPNAAKRSLAREVADAAGEQKHPVYRLLDMLTQKKWAVSVLLVAAVASAFFYSVSLNVKVGDLEAGAPELRPDSRYNRDAAFMSSTYGASSDVFAVMIKTPDTACTGYPALMALDMLEWELRQVAGVESTASLAGGARAVAVGISEGNFKWYELLRNQNTLNAVTNRASQDLMNGRCNLLALFAYLKDHRADTLARVVDKVESFSAEFNTKDVEFQLAAGSAGIEAATNIVVKRASHEMLLWVYGAVFLLCLVTFRSLGAVLCAVVPLMFTSVLCEALMVWLGIGIKVATLPVLALGVGIGVDYALYIMSVMMKAIRSGRSLSDAYYESLLFTGRVVVLTGITLGVAVGTWAYSPIKFQADMGILLAFMFICNMLGALILLPALASVMGLGGAKK
jgi:predicted RND superfamily exporter protein